MDIFSVLALIGGLALFLYGMKQMGDGLEKLSSGKLASMLGALTDSKWKGVLLGAGVTAIIQSSSATTVTVVGFVNSGVMQLRQATSVIMGANIGTTVTAWLLSLTGLSGDSVWISLLKPTSFSPVLAAVGVGLAMFSKNTQKREVGGILAGFAVLMYGMNAMSKAVSPLAGDASFQSLLLLFDNPFFGLLAGMLLTAVIQSSSASVGILQALSVTGAISWGAAIPIILGQNIGTCATALLSGIGANPNARRASVVHLLFNVVGAAAAMAAFLIARLVLPASLFGQPIGAAGIAIAHSAFNLAATALLLPFTNQLEAISRVVVRERKDARDVLLDDRLLATPSFAVSRSTSLTQEMAADAASSVRGALALVGEYDEAKARGVLELEEKIDRYEDTLGSFLVKLTGRSLSGEENRQVTRILHAIGDLERVGDHAVNLVEAAKELYEKRIRFTDDARSELDVLFRALGDALDRAVRAYSQDDEALAKRVEPLEMVVDELCRELKARHVQRLREGRCSVEMGFIFADLLTNVERVADHCSNLAICVIESGHDAYNAHEYLERAEALGEYVEPFQREAEQYALGAPMEKGEA